MKREIIIAQRVHIRIHTINSISQRLSRNQYYKTYNSKNGQKNILNYASQLFTGDLSSIYFNVALEDI